jgi:hypothetical protein
MPALLRVAMIIASPNSLIIDYLTFATLTNPKGKRAHQ